MKKPTMKISHKLAAAITAGAMSSGFVTEALATTDANSLVGNLVKSSKGFTDLISLLGYVGGSGLSVAGIFKLKQHVDNPGQTPMKDGVMRLAAGGALLSLPFITTVMQGSVTESNGGSAVNQANVKVTQFQ